MKVLVDTVADLGVALRAIRRADKLRIDEMAQVIGISKQFATDLENGKETVQLGKVLHVLAQMGITVTLDVPDRAADELLNLATQRIQGDWRRKRPGKQDREPEAER